MMELSQTRWTSALLCLQHKGLITDSRLLYFRYFWRLSLYNIIAWLLFYVFVLHSGVCSLHIVLWRHADTSLFLLRALNAPRQGNQSCSQAVPSVHVVENLGLPSPVTLIGMGTPPFPTVQEIPDSSLQAEAKLGVLMQTRAHWS